MPNIYGKYSLTEAAKLLSVTPAFVNRIQRETGIGGSVGGKGQATSFSEFEVKTFQTIKVLRKLDFSFQDIKEIWKLENDLIGLSDSFTKEEYADFDDWSTISLVVHTRVVKWPAAKSFVNSLNKKMDAYLEELRRLVDASQEVERRRDRFIKETNELSDIMKNWDWSKKK